MFRSKLPYALCALVALGTAACGTSTPGAKPPRAPAGPAGPAVTDLARRGYETAATRFAEHDKANDWNDAACTQMAKEFLDVNAEHRRTAGADLSPALYNAGLSNQRCSRDAEAKKLFQQALAADPKAHRAKVQIALYDYKEKGDAALESTIASLQQAVLDAEFQNPDALVNLAMLQLKRGGPSKGQGCNDDLECSKKNIQRALAIDDGFMPAFNQLALYYLELARSKAGRAKGAARQAASGKRDKRVNSQQLDFAALVCSQAIRKNAKYAPVHNTFGLIHVELGNINNAVQEFKVAAQLDPGFVEAQMNFAAVNLSFRGFENAETAYRQVLKARPDDYEATLGLALALRGRINDQNLPQQVKETQTLLDRAKQIAPNRPETYYNEGILTQEYKVKTVSDSKGQIPILEQAKGIYTSFIQKAGANPEYADQVKRAGERNKDIDDTIRFLREGIKAEEDASKPLSDQPAGLEGEPAGGQSPKLRPLAPPDRGGRFFRRGAGNFLRPALSAPPGAVVPAAYLDGFPRARVHFHCNWPRRIPHGPLSSFDGSPALRRAGRASGGQRAATATGGARGGTGRGTGGGEARGARERDPDEEGRELQLRVYRRSARGWGVVAERRHHPGAAGAGALDADQAAHFVRARDAQERRKFVSGGA
jgi:tetratricopeptide (TPR) repeat protein